MRRIRRSLFFLLLFNFPSLPWAFLPATGARGADWVVLPDRVSPRLAPSSDAETATMVLRYPEVVTGEAVAAPGNGTATGSEPAGAQGTGTAGKAGGAGATSVGATVKKGAEDAARQAGAAKGTDVANGAGAGWVAFERGGKRYYLPSALLVQRVEKPANGENLPIGGERVDRWAALPLDYRPSDLVALDRRWDQYTEKRTLLLRREAAQAAERMLGDAQEKGGVKLRVVSAFRSAETQRALYLDKIAKAGLGQRLVAQPGHSEHQLGTALDLCPADGSEELQRDFAQTAEGRWLRDNVAHYGFRLSFTEATSTATGFDPEPWHVRYMGEAATDGASATAGAGTDRKAQAEKPAPR